MAKRVIIWTRTADLQLAGVLMYWAQRNKSISFSQKLLNQISKTTGQIAENPLLYRSTNVDNIRTASIQNFSIYYKFTEEQITVVAFWDNRQDPQKLLNILERK